MMLQSLCLAGRLPHNLTDRETKDAGYLPCLCSTQGDQDGLSDEHRRSCEAELLATRLPLHVGTG